ncbi:PEP-CTERM motif protein [Rubripirellula amarantea]|uniref:PEP-CTERM motif protein n=1 Tax=Rubripirellula amarantea TaxID=2527999 RepID=A0A5C5WRH0_9BACT|nr:PEP-CTERM sorting domain-containing protein [Rubripirellula amarantea]TWT52779.1 PEP-CTERM motif protein [Rubripirellula amarantea]
MSKLLRAIGSTILGCVITSSASGAVITDVSASTVAAINNWQFEPDGTTLSSTATGGLVTTGSYANPLTLAGIFTIDDSADTGAMFTADLILSGVDNNGANNIYAQSDGHIVFDVDQPVRQESLTLTVGNFQQISGLEPAVITFDGFSELVLVSYVPNATESATFNGIAMTSAATNAVSPLAPNGSTLLDTSPNGTAIFYFDGVRGQFTVATAVPEPSSFAMVGIGGLCVIWHRRRRNSAKSQVV